MKPKISFTFPLRWLKDPEDRKFLHENLGRCAMGGRNKEVLNQSLQNVMNAQNPYNFIPAFTIRIKAYAYQPISYVFTAKDAEKAFKSLLPNARCMAVEKRFVQTTSLTALPTMEMEIFY